jgi:hypothetical protein
MDYSGPVKLGNEETIVYVFAECEGLEAKRNFTFLKKDQKKFQL